MGEEDAPEPMKSAHSSASSRPMRMSRWRLDWGRIGMCGFYGGGAHDMSLCRLTMRK